MLQLTRRELLRTAGAGAAALVLAPVATLAAADTKGYTLPKLPYPYDALEPNIDKETMMIHHDKHHQGYVNNLNKYLSKQPALYGKPMNEVLADKGKKIDETIRIAVLNNGGGHANHTMFWEIMGPKGGGKPSGALAKGIDASFGSFDKFQTAFSTAAGTVFGSGWAWLVPIKGKLEIVQKPNQFTPLNDDHTPILGIDVWEHAYYLKYKNARPDYIKAWWNVVNWHAVAERYAKAGK